MIQVVKKIGTIIYAGLYKPFKNKNILEYGFLAFSVGLLIFLGYKCPLSYLIGEISTKIPNFQLIKYVLFPLLACATPFIALNLGNSKKQFTIKDFIITLIFSLIVMIAGSYLFLVSIYFLPEITEFLSSLGKTFWRGLFPVVYLDSVDSASNDYPLEQSNLRLKWVISDKLESMLKLHETDLRYRNSERYNIARQLEYSSCNLTQAQLRFLEVSSRGSAKILSAQDVQTGIISDYPLRTEYPELGFQEGDLVRKLHKKDGNIY